MCVTALDQFPALKRVERESCLAVLGPGPADKQSPCGALETELLALLIISTSGREHLNFAI